MDALSAHLIHLMNSSAAAANAMSTREKLSWVRGNVGRISESGLAFMCAARYAAAMSQW